MTPQLIKQELDKVVFGQEKAKKTMSLAFYLHLVRNGLLEPNHKTIPLPKPNVLMIGNAGTGKTLMLHTLCNKFQTPILNLDANIFATSNNIGEVLDAYIKYLITQFGFEKATQAVVCIENFDAICNRQQTPAQLSLNIQQDFLQMLEQQERMITIEQGKEPIMFPLNNLMFIFSGRFLGLESLIFVRSKIDDKNYDAMLKKQERLTLINKYKNLQKANPNLGIAVSPIGFIKGNDNIKNEEIAIQAQIQDLYNSLKEDELEQMVEQAFQKEVLEAVNKNLQQGINVLNEATYKDFINYGALPELIGRIGFIAALNDLTKEDIISILTRKDNNLIDQYLNYFKLHKDTLEIKKEVYDLIAQEAIERRIGTRSINAIIVQLLNAVLYDAPNDVTEKFVVDEAFFKRVVG